MLLPEISLTPKSLFIRQTIEKACGRERLVIGGNGFAFQQFPSWVYLVFHVGMFN